MPRNEKMNEAKLRLIEEEKKKLQLQQKALDSNTPLTMAEVKVLQKESTKKIIDRVLFVLGLILATCLMVIIIWPMFSISMSFFNFNNPEAAYNHGQIIAYANFDWASGYTYEEDHIYYLKDECEHDKNSSDASIHTKDCFEQIPHLGILRKTVSNTDKPEETFIYTEGLSSIGRYKDDNGVYKTVSDTDWDRVIKNQNRLWYNPNIENLGVSSVFVKLITENTPYFSSLDRGKGGSELDARVEKVRASNTLSGGASVWGTGKLSDEFYNELNQQQANKPGSNYLRNVGYTFKATRGIFFIGFAPGDPSCAILYTICGLLFFIFLIALVVLYIVLMSYGIRYFVGLIKGVTKGAVTLVKDAGHNVAGAVLEESIDSTLETVQEQQARKRKEAAAKRKATMERKKREAEAATSDAVPVTVEMGTDEEPTVKSEDAVLDDLTDDQLDALLNGEAPADTPRDSLFSDDEKSE